MKGPALLAALLAPTVAWAQVVTENAGTISPETPLWQNRFEYFKAENLTDLRLVETFVWAPNGVMDLALTLPLIHRDVSFGTVEGGFEAVGDATLRWKLSIFKRDDIMKSTRFSGLAGVKFPTGPWREEVDGVAAPRKLQPGTGSWDIFGGALFTFIDDRHRFAAEVIGRHNFEAFDFRLQPSLRVGAAYWYRISPARLEIAGAETEIRGVIELTSIFYGESRLAGTGLDDAGNITWLSPGIQVYPSVSVLFELSVQIPVIETVEDALGRRRVGVLFSIKFLF
jgi:hypothetical protein